MQPAATRTQSQGQHVRPDGTPHGMSPQELETLMEDSMPAELWDALQTKPNESPVIALPDAERPAAELPIALPDAPRDPASVLCEPDEEEMDKILADLPLPGEEFHAA